MIIEVKQGQLEGQSKESILTGKEYYSFLGIPYAKPPIGELRFQAKTLKDFTRNSIQPLMIEDFATLAALGFHMAMYYYGAAFGLVILILLYFIPQLRIWFFFYFCWIYYDRNTPRTCGRKSKWYSNLKMFKLMADYFPIRLIKTADLPEGRNYMLAAHPHGTLPFSIFTNFLANGASADTFPGIEMRLVLLDAMYIVPFIREMTLAIGGHSCKESSFTNLLKSKPSKGIIVLPGGAAEMEYTRPGSIYKIVKRKGFVRLALATGTPMVPVFIFGEINAWTKLFALGGKQWKRLSKYFFNCSTAYIISVGRGLLPMKVPLNTIVGAPIQVPKVENPSNELIDEYYEKFYQALADLFEKYKYEYDIAGGEARLIMLEK